MKNRTEFELELHFDPEQKQKRVKEKFTFTDFLSKLKNGSDQNFIINTQCRREAKHSRTNPTGAKC